MCHVVVVVPDDVALAKLSNFPVPLAADPQLVVK
jgi:hypothetical protein